MGDADPLMYAKIAGTDVTDAEAFAKKAIAEINERAGRVRGETDRDRQDRGRRTIFRKRLRRERRLFAERACRLHPDAESGRLVVFSAEEKATLEKHANALTQLLKSFRAMDAKVDGPKE